MDKKTLAIAALLGLFATPAMAQTAAPAPKAESDNGSGFYAGAGINLYFIDKDDAAEGLPVTFIDQPSPGAFLGRFGYAFNKYIAVEIEAGFGGADSEFEGGGSTLNIGVDTPLGAHVVFTPPIGGGGGYFLGKVGYASVTVTRELNGIQAPDIEVNGVSVGAGGGFRGGSWDFRGELGLMSGGDTSSAVLGMYALNHF